MGPFATSKTYLKLKEHLLERGITVKWWISRYIPRMKYGTVMAQFTGYNVMSRTVEEAIEQYLKEYENDRKMESEDRCVEGI